jgi:predicted RecA/RadA family phage recombinase
MKNYICDGERIQVTLTGAVSPGDVVIVGMKTAIAITGGKTGDVIVAQTEGVFELPKVAGATLYQGARLYWDSNNGVATSVASTNMLLGYAYVSAASNDATVQCCIVDNPNTTPLVANQVPSSASDVAGLKADFNALLDKLKTAGIMAQAD